MMMAPKQKAATSKQDYRTPREFVAAVETALDIDQFCIDLAASKANTVNPRRFFTKRDDALAQAWPLDGWCWLNPPYARLEPWAKKCYEEAQKGCKIALLVPAAVGSNWFRDWIHLKALVVCFLNGRLAFIPEKPSWGYPKDCMLVLFNGSTTGETAYVVWDWRHE